MTLKTWRPDATQWQAATRAIYSAFGSATLGDETELKQNSRPPERRLAVVADDSIIGGCFSYPFDLTVPGGASVAAAGLAGVGISPPEQGRGGLRAMMQGHIEQSIELGDVASVLMASEGGIYGRYGYGMATEMAQWHVYAADAVFNDAASVAGTVELVHDRRVAIDVLEPIYRKASARQVGAIHRSLTWWQLILEPDEADWIAVGKEHFVAVHYDANDRADGYAIYGIPDDSSDTFEHGRAAVKVVVKELVGVDVNAEIALFDYLRRLPWCRELIWELAPTQPLLRHYLQDPRQLWQRGRVDMMWLRPLHFERLMLARHYAADGELTIAYSDPQIESQSACWTLRVNQGRAELALGTTAQLQLDAASLGAIYLGGTRALELATVGRIRGDADAIRTLDRMLLCDAPPFNATRF
jgi:predicted acetyltransferase